MLMRRHFWVRLHQWMLEHSEQTPLLFKRAVPSSPNRYLFCEAHLRGIFSAKLTSQVSFLPKSCLTGLPKLISYRFLFSTGVFMQTLILLSLPKITSQVSCFWLNFPLAQNSDQQLMPAGPLLAKTMVGTCRKHLKSIWLLSKEILFLHEIWK